MVEVSDVLKNKNVYNAARTYRRYSSLILGGGAGVVFAVLPWVAFVQRPNIGQLHGVITISFFGLFIVTVVVIVFVRQGRRLKSAKGASAASDKVTYSDATGDVVQYQVPDDSYVGEDRNNLLANQSCVALLAPVGASGLHERGLLGVTTYLNQENTIILTDSAVLALQIPFTSETANDDGALADIAALRGVDAGTQNVVAMALGGDVFKKLIHDVVASTPLPELAVKYYSYILPISWILSIDEGAMGNVELKTKNGGVHIWMCTDQAARGIFVQEVKKRIVAIPRNGA